MNTISYVILAMLIRKSLSGKELQDYLQLFWESHHSQIYPVLKQLRMEGYIEIVDMPDKKTKIYAITQSGKEQVRPWISEETKAPTQKDEFLAKLYALSIVNQEVAETLLDERKLYLQTLLKSYKQRYKELEEVEKDAAVLSRLLVLNRKIRLLKEEIKWCKWAKETILNELF